jgi:hypothetical protein
LKAIIPNYTKAIKSVIDVISGNELFETSCEEKQTDITYRYDQNSQKYQKWSDVIQNELKNITAA